MDFLQNFFFRCIYVVQVETTRTVAELGKLLYFRILLCSEKTVLLGTIVWQKKNFPLKSPFYYVFTFSVRFWGKFSFLGGQKN